MLMHSEYIRIIIKYYKQTARVIILKSTQKKANHFEMIMKSLCNSKLQQIYAFICYNFPGHPLLVNIAMPIEQEKSIKARNSLKCRLGNFQSLQTTNRRRKFKK